MITRQKYDFASLCGSPEKYGFCMTGSHLVENIERVFGFLLPPNNAASGVESKSDRKSPVAWGWFVTFPMDSSQIILEHGQEQIKTSHDCHVLPALQDTLPT